MRGARPDFFIVGAPKCGTTMLNDALAGHPEVFVPEAKEIHYFGSDLEWTVPRDDEATYLARFRGAQRYKRAGEASVWYLVSRLAAREIHAFEPAARVIIMLRDPVDVMHAQHSQALWNARGDEDIEDFAEALAAEDDRRSGRRIPPHNTLRQCLYYREIVRFTPQVKRYLDTFGRERVHVVVHEDLVADLAGEQRKVLEFLDVDARVGLGQRVVNPNKVVRSPGLRRALSAVPEPLKGLVPGSIREELSQRLKRWNTRYERRAPLDPALRAQLDEELADDVERLSELLGRDLTHWTRAEG